MNKHCLMYFMLLMSLEVVAADKATVKTVCGKPPSSVKDQQAAFRGEETYSAQAARDALSALEKLKRTKDLSAVDFETQIYSINTVDGYLRKYRAEISEDPKDRKMFCKWLFSSSYYPE